MSHRLMHDSAFAAVMNLMSLLPRTLTPEERQAFFHAAYQALMGMLDIYQTLKVREEQRLYRPGLN